MPVILAPSCSRSRTAMRVSHFSRWSPASRRNQAERATVEVGIGSPFSAKATSVSGASAFDRNAARDHHLARLAGVLVRAEVPT